MYLNFLNEMLIFFFFTVFKPVIKLDLYDFYLTDILPSFITFFIFASPVLLCSLSYMFVFIYKKEKKLKKLKK